MVETLKVDLVEKNLFEPLALTDSGNAKILGASTCSWGLTLTPDPTGGISTSCFLSLANVHCLTNCCGFGEYSYVF